MAVFVGLAGTIAAGDAPPASGLAGIERVSVAVAALPPHGAVAGLSVDELHPGLTALLRAKTPQLQIENASPERDCLDPAVSIEEGGNYYAFGVLHLRLVRAAALVATGIPARVTVWDVIRPFAGGITHMHGKVEEALAQAVGALAAAVPTGGTP
jgi:hypothetical protein